MRKIRFVFLYFINTYQFTFLFFFIANDLTKRALIFIFIIVWSNFKNEYFKRRILSV